MNILILNWRDPQNPKAGGAEYVTYEHAKAWVRYGHKVTWFTTYFPKALTRETLDGIEIHRRGNQFSVFFHAYIFYRKSKDMFSVVIDEMHGLPFFTPLYVKVPIIAFIHEVAAEIWDYMYPFPLNIFGRIIERWSFHFYRKIPFWTDATSTIDDLVHMGISRASCLAIPCPISSPPIASLPAKEDDPTFIFVSRIVPMKGVEDVISAFAIISKKEKNANLWIIGRGTKSYIMKLKQKAASLGLSQSVQFFEFVSNEKKLTLMRRAHILLHASVKEGWGLVVLEAASQATPTVAYDVSGLRDTVHGGRTGILVKRREPELLARESLALLKNKALYTSMQKACLVWAGSLKWEDVTKESLKLLSNVARD